MWRLSYHFPFYCVCNIAPWSTILVKRQKSSTQKQNPEAVVCLAPPQVVKLFAEAISYAGDLDTTSLFHYRERESQQRESRRLLL